MPIYYREPVFTIGQVPLVAGAIVVRNHRRARKKYERQLRRNALKARLRLFGHGPDKGEKPAKRF